MMTKKEWKVSSGFFQWFNRIPLECSKMEIMTNLSQPKMNHHHSLFIFDQSILEHEGKLYLDQSSILNHSIMLDPFSIKFIDSDYNFFYMKQRFFISNVSLESILYTIKSLSKKENLENVTILIKILSKYTFQSNSSYLDDILDFTWIITHRGVPSNTTYTYHQYIWYTFNLSWSWNLNQTFEWIWLVKIGDSKKWDFGSYGR